MRCAPWAGHFGAFVIASAVMFFTQGEFPFWLGIWGAVLAIQTLKAAPTVLALSCGAPAGR